MLVIVMMHDGSDSIRTSGEPQDTIAMVIVMLLPRVVVEYTMVCHGNLPYKRMIFMVNHSAFNCYHGRNILFLLLTRMATTT